MHETRGFKTNSLTQEELLDKEGAPFYGTQMFSIVSSKERIPPDGSKENYYTDFSQSDLDGRS